MSERDELLVKAQARATPAAADSPAAGSAEEQRRSRGQSIALISLDDSYRSRG